MNFHLIWHSVSVLSVRFRRHSPSATTKKWQQQQQQQQRRAFVSYRFFYYLVLFIFLLNGSVLPPYLRIIVDYVAVVFVSWHVAFAKNHSRRKFFFHFHFVCSFRRHTSSWLPFQSSFRSTFVLCAVLWVSMHLRVILRRAFEIESVHTQQKRRKWNGKIA